MSFYWLSIVGLLSAWFLKTIYQILTCRLRNLPGPFYSRFSRLPLKLSIIRGERIYYIHSLHEQYGPIVRISPKEVSVSSLNGFKQIHKAGSPFLKSPWYETFTQATTSLGVFAMRDPKQHAQRRKLFARSFSKSELRRNWEDVVQAKAHLAVSRIQEEMMGPSGAADILKWWTFFTTDVSGHLMFGESFNMLEFGRKNEYIQVLESTMLGSGLASELPLLRTIGRHIPLPSFRAMFRANEYLFDYGRRAIANTRSHNSNSKTIFTGMVNEAEKGEPTLSDTDVISEAGNLIVAGSDTTAITLTYLVYAVLSRPDLREKLEQEVSALPPNYDDAALESLPLLNAVIAETLRLYGAAPGSLPRTVPEGGAQFEYTAIPGGVTVSTQSWTLHRDPNIFPNPEKFDPSRWLPGTFISSDAQAAFTPFGAGSRICLGINLAWMELRIASAEFFRRCRAAKLAESTTPASMKPENHFLIWPTQHKCDIKL